MTPRVRKYVAEVAAERGIAPEIILSSTRLHAVARARQDVMRRLHRDNFSLCQIGRWLDRHPSTVHYAVHRADVA